MLLSMRKYGSPGWPISFLGDRAQYSFILNQRPLAVRIVFLHRLPNPGSLFTKITLKNFAVLIDDKSHDTRLIPMLRISHQRESTGQVALVQVIHFTTGRVLALPGQNSEIITV